MLWHFASTGIWNHDSSQIIWGMIGTWGFPPNHWGFLCVSQVHCDESDPSGKHIRVPIVRLSFPIPFFPYMSTTSSYHTAPACQDLSLSNGDHPWMNAVNNYQPASTEVCSFSPIGLILVLIVLIGWILCLLRTCIHRSQVQCPRRV